MRKNNRNKSLVFTLLLAAITLTGFAEDGPLSFLTPYKGPEKDVINLIITGNYVKSKMMAELIQNENKQPFILVPSVDKDFVWFCPSRVKKPLQISKKNFGRFLKFVNPEQIVVLGDKRYVSKEYLKMIDPAQTVWVVRNNDWNKIAESVSKLLYLSNLKSDFKRLSEEYDAKQYYKPDRNDPTAQVAEKVESERITIEETADGELVEVEDVSLEEEMEFEEKTDEKIVEEPEILEPESDPELIEDK